MIPAVASGEGGGAMKDHAVWRAPVVSVGDRYVDRPRDPRSQLPERRRAVMAEQGSGPAREQGGGFVGEVDFSAVSGIDGAVLDEQPRVPQTPVDRRRSDARGQQLPSGHPGALLPGDRCYHIVRPHPCRDAKPATTHERDRARRLSVGIRR